MQFKSIAVITVLLLVVASLLVSGCVNNTTNQTSSESSTATHDAFLEKYLAEYKNLNYADKNLSFRAWEVTWINSTSARVEFTLHNNSANVTGNNVVTFTVFPTSQDATNYINAMNKTAYSLASTIYEGVVYTKVTGHAPQIYKKYEWNEGNPFNISEYRYHTIEQFDNLIAIRTTKILNN